MWRLATARQLLLLVALAMVLLDASAVAASIGALERAGSFASFARALFEESTTLGDALEGAASGNGACIAAIALYVLARPWPMAWIRASYIGALAGSGGLARPAWPAVLRLVLLDVCIATPLAFGIGLLEKGDLAVVGPPVLLAVLMLTLYADYAIVIDDVGLRRSFRSSLHVLVQRPGASLGATAGWLTLSFILYGSVAPSFEDGATPLTLTTLAIGTAALGFALDCCLITLYRATPPPGDDEL